MNRIAMPPAARSATVGSIDPACPGLLGNVSIIVPVGPGDTSWRSLVSDLSVIDKRAELWLAAVDPAPDDLYQLAAEIGLDCAVHWVVSSPGRARQMNVGAAHATHPILWFLHADSRLEPNAIVALDRSLAFHPDELHFFDLEFQPDGPAATRCNAWGVYVRSRYLGLPFGDQGLCLRREQFIHLGGFSESVPYGEDHLLVWEAHRQRIKLCPVGASISTSARRYHAHGWLRTTGLHLWRTCQQALLQLAKLLWSHVR